MCQRAVIEVEFHVTPNANMKFVYTHHVYNEANLKFTQMACNGSIHVFTHHKYEVCVKTLAVVIEVE